MNKKSTAAIALITALSFPFAVDAEAPKSSAPKTEAKPRIVAGPTYRMNGGGIVGTGKTQAERDIEQYEQVVTLTAEQKQRIKDIYDARDKELKDYQASIADKLPAQQAAMNEAVKSQDQKRIEEARKAFMALFAPQQAIVKRGQESLKGVLTPDQKSKVQQHRFMTTLAAYAPGVDFTEGQINLLKISCTTGSGELEGYEGLLYELINKTLTAEQTKTALKHRTNQMLAATFRNAQLTPDQQRKIDARITVMLEQHPKTMQLDSVVFQKLRDYVNELLTAEQKEAMKFPRAG